MSQGTELELRRQALLERKHDSLLEDLLDTIPQMNDAEKANMIALADENEDQAFEVRCRVFASFAESGREEQMQDRTTGRGVGFGRTETGLSQFVDTYNALARKNGWRSYTYQYARELAMVGRKLEAVGKRMQDFPSVTSAFFTEALRARDFVDALQIAQDRLHAHELDPDRVEPFTKSMFRQIIAPAPREKPQERKTKSAPAPEPTDILVDADVAASETPASTPAVPVARVEETPERVGEYAEAPDPEPLDNTRTCYSCEKCCEIGDEQRLALVEVAPDGKTMNEFLCAFVPCKAWYCSKRRILLAVHSRQEEAARARAAVCDSFFRGTAGKAGTVETSGFASVEPMTADDILDMPPDVESSGDPGEV